MPSRTIKTSSEQLQKKFKHAGDFDLTTNYSPGNETEFDKAVKAHVADPSTKVINGSYRREPVTHYVNEGTGLNVMVDPDGNFISGWKLSTSQMKHVLTTGKLGGG